MASAWATMIVYGAQMTASYLLGQKYYPIKYNLRKFCLYLGLAILFYFIATAFNIEEGMVQFFVHNTFIVVFVALIYILEKPTKQSPPKVDDQPQRKTIIA